MKIVALLEQHLLVCSTESGDEVTPPPELQAMKIVVFWELRLSSSLDTGEPFLLHLLRSFV
jgi:hypothetical protein